MFACIKYTCLKFICGFLIITIIGMSGSGCSDVRNIEPPEVVYEDDPSASPNTGRFVMYVFNNDAKFSPQNDVNLALYNTLEDLEKDIPLQVQVTRNRGRADFNYLNAGNYYVHVYYRLPQSEQSYQRTITVQVQAQKTLTRNLVMY